MRASATLPWKDYQSLRSAFKHQLQGDTTVHLLLEDIRTKQPALLNGSLTYDRLKELVKIAGGEGETITIEELQEAIADEKRHLGNGHSTQNGAHSEANGNGNTKPAPLLNGYRPPIVEKRVRNLGQRPRSQKPPEKGLSISPSVLSNGDDHTPQTVAARARISLSVLETPLNGTKLDLKPKDITLSRGKSPENKFIPGQFYFAFRKEQDNFIPDLEGRSFKFHSWGKIEELFYLNFETGQINGKPFVFMFDINNTYVFKVDTNEHS